MFLVDCRDARFMRSGRISTQSLSPDADFAAVRCIESGHQFDERGLARAVLPDQRVNLAGPHLERDIIEREHARKGLGDAIGDKHDAVQIGLARLFPFHRWRRVHR